MISRRVEGQFLLVKIRHLYYLFLFILYFGPSSLQSSKLPVMCICKNIRADNEPDAKLYRGEILCHLLIVLFLI